MDKFSVVVAPHDDVDRLYTPRRLHYCLLRFHLYKKTFACFEVDWTADTAAEYERGNRVCIVMNVVVPRKGKHANWNGENLARAGNWDIRAFAV